tara:strand:- start:535 stop:777 length:243 start_codon:yes stop_codon:yes gene_type:complete
MFKQIGGKMKITINKNDNPRTVTAWGRDIDIDATDENTTINFEGKSLKIWVDGEIIYIYPKGGQRETTDVVFMNKVISKQ